MDSPNLTSLFSKSRAALLEQLYIEGLPRAHLRQLQRTTGLNPATVHRELKHLVATHWLIEIQDGNRVLYQANPDHPCLEEMVSIVRKMTTWVSDLRQWAQGRESIHSAWIFGSYAQGNFRPESDIDLLLVTTDSLQTILSQLKPIIQPLGYEVNPKIYTPDEFAKATTEANPFLTRVLNGPIIALK